MYFKLLLLLVCVIVMSDFVEDDENYSLSGLTQEGHEVDVTVISDSDDNYDGLLVYAKTLEMGKNENLNLKSDDSIMVNNLVKVPGAKVRAEGVLLKLPASELNVSNNMASSVEHEDKSIGVKFVEIFW